MLSEEVQGARKKCVKGKGKLGVTKTEKSAYVVKLH